MPLILFQAQPVCLFLLKIAHFIKWPFFIFKLAPFHEKNVLFQSEIAHVVMKMPHLIEKVPICPVNAPFHRENSLNWIT